MMHIASKPGHIDYDKYRTYLESIKDRLPAGVYAFASNPSHFNLESHSSLHDAWLENITVSETTVKADKSDRQLEIHLCLLGPFHDLKIHLRYTGVAGYSFSGIKKPAIGHGDLFTHEIRLSENGLVLHELGFVGGSTFIIECSGFTHSEEPVANS